MPDAGPEDEQHRQPVSKNSTDSWVRAECCVGVGGAFGEDGHDGGVSNAPRSGRRRYNDELTRGPRRSSLFVAAGAPAMNALVANAYKIV